MNGELNVRFMSDSAAVKYRQLCVDAYAVQHPGSPGPQTIQSVAVHLISLYAQLELGLATEAAPALLQRAVQMKGRFRWMTPPSFVGVRTIADVIGQGDRIEEAAREWACEGFRAWAEYRGVVKEWYEMVYGANC